MLRSKLSIAGVVFDLDGTLIDSAPDLRTSLNRVLTGRGRRDVTLDEVHHMVGNGAVTLIERAFAATGGAVPDNPDDLLVEFLDHYEGNGAVLTKAFPGADKMLAALRDAGYVIGLCTNKPQRPTEIVLHELGLDHHFVAIVGGDAVRCGDGQILRKPDPGHLIYTLDLMGVSARNALMIGDSAADVGVAKSAGVPMIAVSFGYTNIPVRELGADQVIDRLDQLPSILSRMRAPVA